jgi:hypothetical protein
MTMTIVTIDAVCLQIVAEAEDRAPGDAVLGEMSLKRMSALSVPDPPGGYGNGGSAPATLQQQQVPLTMTFAHTQFGAEGRLKVD